MLEAHFLGRAIEIASSYHVGQRDKGGNPYILHPLRVMQSVRAAGYPLPYQICAVLHDVLEDTFCTPEKLGLVFAPHIVEAVQAITRRYENAAPGGELYNKLGAKAVGPALETHSEYIDRCLQNPIARVVKYYDTLDNADPRRYAPEVPLGRYQKVLQRFYENPDLLRVE